MSAVGASVGVGAAASGTAGSHVTSGRNSYLPCSKRAMQLSGPWLQQQQPSLRGSVVALARRKWYAVVLPEEHRGVYREWEEVRSRVSGFSNHVHRGFPSEAAALCWLLEQVDTQERQDEALQPLRHEVLAAAAAAAAGAESSAAAAGAGATRATGSTRKTAARATHELGAGATGAASTAAADTASPSGSGRRAPKPAGRSAPRPWETAAVTVLPDVVTEPSRQYFRKWYAVRFVDGGQPAVYNNWPDAQAAVRGSPYAEHRSFQDYTEAVAYAFGPEHLHRVPLPPGAHPAEEPEEEPEEVQHQQQQQQAQGWPALAASSSRALGALGAMAASLATTAARGGRGRPLEEAAAEGGVEDFLSMPPPTSEMFAVALASGGVPRQGGGSGGGGGGAPRPLPVSPYLDAPLPLSAAAPAPAPQHISTASPHFRAQPSAQRVLTSGDVTHTSPFADPLWPKRQPSPPPQQQQSAPAASAAGAAPVPAAEPGPRAEAPSGPPAAGPEWLRRDAHQAGEPGPSGRASSQEPVPSLTSVPAEAAAAPAEARRGRGRPRKTLVLAGPEAAAAPAPDPAAAAGELGAAPRRGRGRPRKTNEPAAAAPEAAIAAGAAAAGSDRTAEPDVLRAAQAAGSQSPAAGAAAPPPPPPPRSPEQAVLLDRMRVAGIATRLAAEWLPCMSLGGLQQLVQDCEAERERLVARINGTSTTTAAAASRLNGCTSPQALANAADAARRAACLGAHSAALLQQLYDRTGAASGTAGGGSGSGAAASAAGASAQAQVFVLEALLDVLWNNLPPPPPQQQQQQQQQPAASPLPPLQNHIVATAASLARAPVAAPAPAAASRTLAAQRTAAEAEAAERPLGSRAARILARARCAAARSKSTRVALAPPADSARLAEAGAGSDEGAGAGGDGVEVVAEAPGAASTHQPDSGRGTGGLGGTNPPVVPSASGARPTAPAAAASTTSTTSAAGALAPRPWAGAARGARQPAVSRSAAPRRSPARP